MCDRKPTCGSTGVSTDDTLTTILATIGVLGTISGAVGGAIKTAGESGLVSLGGIAAPAGVWIAAAAAAVATAVIINVFYVKRCYPVSDKQQACSSGVVQHIESSFSSAAEELFPFAAMHDRVDVVIICDYWFLVEGGGAQFVKCAPDPETSPMLLGFYYSKEVCGAGSGAVVGAGAAVVPAILLGVLAGAAIGCATIILCLFALLIAAIIAAAVVLVGAFVGGQIGKAAAGNSTPSAGGNALSIGDLVTTQGGLITNGEQDGARTYWWVDSTALHGRSAASAPFSHLDAEVALKDPTTGALLDACPRRIPPIE
ncbi:MAG: hypothetical protein K8L97_11880 [Anaerolineae bacterium]|nr:hypothetical protein [Anaerolineae bacterium]